MLVSLQILKKNYSLEYYKKLGEYQGEGEIFFNNVRIYIWILIILFYRLEKNLVISYNKFIL